MGNYISAAKMIYPSPNFTSNRGGIAITGITIHHWNDPQRRPTFAGTVNWLRNPVSNVSAHFVVEDNRVASLVDPKDQAWHALSGNKSTIGIEVSPYGREGDYATLVGLIVALWLNYGKVNLYKHSDWVPTACPGVYATEANWARIRRDADALYAQVTGEDCAARNLYEQYVNPWWRGGSGTYIPGRGRGFGDVPELPEPFPLPAGHYYGPISGPTESHGGANVDERRIVRIIQQRLIAKGHVPGVTDTNSPWADGIYEGPTVEAVKSFQRSALPNRNADGRVDAVTYTALATQA